MNLLDNVIYKKLEEKKYEAILTDFIADENDKGGYIKLYWDIPSEDRKLIQTVFPGGNFSYVMGCLHRQLGLEDENVSVREILNKAKQGEVLNLWISYNDLENGRKQQMNFGLTEPKPGYDVVEATTENIEQASEAIEM